MRRSLWCYTFRFLRLILDLLNQFRQNLSTDNIGSVRGDSVVRDLGRVVRPHHGCEVKLLIKETWRMHLCHHDILYFENEMVATHLDYEIFTFLKLGRPLLYNYRVVVACEDSCLQVYEKTFLGIIYYRCCLSILAY